MSNEWRTGKPEKGGRYLVTVDYQLEGFVMELGLFRGQWYAFGYDEVVPDSQVHAWMPLPEPYKDYFDEEEVDNG